MSCLTRQPKQQQSSDSRPQNYDDKGRIKKCGKRRLVWHDSKGYLATRRRLAAKERKPAAHLDPANPLPSIAYDEWEGVDLRLLAAVEVLQQRAKEGQVLPRNVGIPRAGARLPESLAPNQLELV